MSIGIRLGRQRLQFRVEALNVGNQTQTPTFGSLTAAEAGRIIQLAVKYSF